MDLDGVRTFVAAADLGQFQAAADELGLTPQAVSKRVAALEHDIGAVLFTRTPHGVRLTSDGQTFLPHAQDLLGAAERARQSVRPEARPLRVDVPHRRVAPSVVLQDFHVAHPELDVEVVTLPNNTLAGALTAVHSGSVDASFRAVTMPAADMPDGLTAARAIDHELELLVGPKHPLAGRTSIDPRDVAGHRIWIPGIAPGTEWAAFYSELADAFGLTIDGRGPHFGDEALLETLCQATDIATVVGKRDRYLWPSWYELRRIPLRNPTPVYPHSLVWLSANPHPGLATLRNYLGALHKPGCHEPDVWLPSWADAATGSLAETDS
ncbi:LysR family transcriptional regulator [Mycolicibacterium wolinskyi]|uniref:Probable hydrogen peroxide-inducible genes activator n=1 Tax=Mycolicibacterium wolinskyi TaxID=59750 RepID=A0A132PGW5_9MYCO|nr:LysR family transcriptional regulator [Mycolicibacterium wolinskyi]KWX21589.1 LysR family transcriptional regulator [Mycolicibacterium wolinskyi]